MDNPLQNHNKRSWCSVISAIKFNQNLCIQPTNDDDVVLTGKLIEVNLIATNASCNMGSAMHEEDTINVHVMM